MKVKLPILQPRSPKRSTTVNTYTKHLVQSSRLSVVLVGVIAILVVILIVFNTRIQEFIKTSTVTKSQSTSSTVSLPKKVITIKTLFNQVCIVEENVNFGIKQSVSSPASVWYTPLECPLGLVAVRVVPINNFADPLASKIFSPPEKPVTYLVYSDSKDSPALNLDLERYQLYLTYNIISNLTLFDQTKVFSQYKEGRVTYFLTSECASASKSCSIWKQNSLIGTTEKLYTLETFEAGIQFSKKQILGSITLLQKKSDSTTLFVIDTDINNSVLKQTYSNTDPVLDTYR